MNVRRTAAALTSAAALSITGVAMAAPASAAPLGGPVVTGGLVNVTIVDAVDINDVTVQLPIAAAVNVCNISVLAIAEQNNTCTADADSRANR